MDTKKNVPVPLRVAIYLAGVVTVSLGIVLCKKCNLGISPISSVPFVVEIFTPISFGMLTMLFHFINTGLQLILMRKVSLWVLLQIPLAFVFGWVIDFLNKIVQFDSGIVVNQVLALIFSVLFTAFGMLLMLGMDLVQNPPDGTVKLIAEKCGREVGQIKIFYDITCVVLSVSIGLIVLHRVEGIGIATIVSAIFVGRVLTWLRMLVSKLQRKQN